MDNQHRAIKGYRELSVSDVELINQIKEAGNAIGVICSQLATDPAADQRWVAIGRTHFQEGVMALVRAIARPDGF